MTPAFPRFTHAARDVDNSTVIQRSGRGARTEGDPLEMTGRGRRGAGGPPAQNKHTRRHSITCTLSSPGFDQKGSLFVWADRSDLTSEIHSFTSISLLTVFSFFLFSVMFLRNLRGGGGRVDQSHSMNQASLLCTGGKPAGPRLTKGRKERLPASR